MQPLPELPFRDQALESPDRVRHLFNSSRIKQALHTALVEYAAKDDEGKTYLSLFQNQSEAIVETINMFGSLVATQLKMDGNLEKIDFQFQDIPNAYVKVIDGVQVIHLPIKQTVMSIAIDPTSFSWLAWAIAHELFHIYIDERYEKHGELSRVANIIGILFHDPQPYNIDLGEIACELYSIDFLRKLAAHLEGKRHIHAVELRNRANDLVNKVRPRMAGRFVEVAAATA